MLRPALRRRAARVAVVAGSVAAVVASGAAGCGDDDADGPADRLAEQVAGALAGGAEDVRARLDTLGVAVDRADLEDLEAGDVRCPVVESPDAGDRATCDVALRPAEILVDVEFEADGSVSVIGIEVRSLRGGAEEVERAVRDLVAGRLGAGAGEVSATCPGVGGVGEMEPGEPVTCSVSTGGGAATSVEVAIDDSGALTLVSAVLDRADVEAFLAGELEGPAEGPVAVSCGDEPSLVRPVGGVVACEAVREADGEQFDVRVEVASVDGELTYEVSAR